ncbi:hypothetical protein [Streptomyces sp. NPDC020817]|uniref:hypothetical protein n=1 Tax=Streptomyces sp. NPDC020817 TaxID=3365095 RepID=UPI0037AD91EA
MNETISRAPALPWWLALTLQPLLSRDVTTVAGWSTVRVSFQAPLARAATVVS